MINVLNQLKGTRGEEWGEGEGEGEGRGRERREEEGRGRERERGERREGENAPFFFFHLLSLMYLCSTLQCQ